VNATTRPCDACQGVISKMAKYLFLVPDGAADEPQEALGGLTPLQAAETPHFDALARKGEVGLAHTVPEGLEAQSDVANMSLLGYDPLKYYSGRGPLEALAQGVDLGPKDVAFRCNLISCDGEKLVSFSGGHVTTEEARELMTYLDNKLGTRQLKFFPGISYRNLLVWREGPVDSKTFAPHTTAPRKPKRKVRGVTFGKRPALQGQAALAASLPSSRRRWFIGCASSNS